ncbi:MAG: NTP transferase domain-containing protein [Candidatus Tectomicrobia bacterium]|uniref:NTP transferase domain-containing protein n=1 Tax=Tectimicrobiota bacterium TaxID=2528274 RepID=A0A932CLN1_UNCTE|nr:NTP transferase domain-containing protein [Candidatus Tectomicrobia bacterium]
MATIILAAGKGVRMRSERPKALHLLKGVPLVRYPVQVSQALGSSRIVVVVGYQAEAVRQTFPPGEVEFAEQREQLGSGHAALQALPRLEDFSGEVLILSGDVPLLKVQTLKGMVQRHREEGVALTFLTTLPPDPKGYGRVVRGDDGRVLRIVEERDATPAEKGLREINAGIYCCAKSFLSEALPRIERNNQQAEYYLTDLVEMASSEGQGVLPVVVTDFWEVLGVNTPEELAHLEAVF